MTKSAEQRRWHNALSGVGCIATGHRQVHLHHTEGRCFKHKGQSIGEWLVLPIYIPLHDVHSNHPLNVTHHKHAFHARYGDAGTLLRKAVERVLQVDPSAAVPPEWVPQLSDDLYQTHEDTTAEWLEKLGA